MVREADAIICHSLWENQQVTNNAGAHRENQEVSQIRAESGHLIVTRLFF